MAARVAGSRRSSRYTGSTARRSARSSAGSRSRGSRRPCGRCCRVPPPRSSRSAAAVFGTTFAAAVRRISRWSPVSRRTTAPLAKTTSGRGQRLTLAMRCEPSRSRRSVVDRVRDWRSTPSSPSTLGARGREPARARAERAQGCVGHARLLGADRQPSEVARRGQAVFDAERPPHGAGKDADPHQAQRSQLLEHRADELALQDALLEPVAVDQQRGAEGAQAVSAELVPRPAAREREVGAAVLHRRGSWTPRSRGPRRRPWTTRIRSAPCDSRATSSANAATSCPLLNGSSIVSTRASAARSPPTRSEPPTHAAGDRRGGGQCGGERGGRHESWGEPTPGARRSHRDCSLVLPARTGVNTRVDRCCSGFAAARAAVGCGHPTTDRKEPRVPLHQAGARRRRDRRPGAGAGRARRRAGAGGPQPAAAATS